jgi:ParB-like chromosome segregation protein Spo0J
MKLENIMNLYQLLQNLPTITKELSTLPLDTQVSTLNTIRQALHDVSPFKTEPVDFVKWIKNTDVTANDYNPNQVATTEMKLLELSIEADGYTQPIVGFQRPDKIEVVDGFHRHRVGKESESIQKRVHGYLPVVNINTATSDISDRMASTIRHNRARGKHKVQSMSEIVLDLKRRRWSDEKIAKNLGMESDEVLRLSQIGGIVSLFEEAEYSQAWEAEFSDPTLIDEMKVLNNGQ